MRLRGALIPVPIQCECHTLIPIDVNGRAAHALVGSQEANDEVSSVGASHGNSQCPRRPIARRVGDPAGLARSVFVAAPPWCTARLFIKMPPRAELCPKGAVLSGIDGGEGLAPAASPELLKLRRREHNWSSRRGRWRLLRSHPIELVQPRGCATCGVVKRGARGGLAQQVYREQGGVNAVRVRAWMRHALVPCLVECSAPSAPVLLRPRPKACVCSGALVAHGSHERDHRQRVSFGDCSVTIVGIGLATKRRLQVRECLGHNQWRALRTKPHR